MSVSQAVSIAAVLVWVNRQLVYFREFSVGHSRLAYYCAVNVAQVLRVVFVSVHFSMVYHVLSRPAIEFGDLLLLVYTFSLAVSGLATVLTLLIAPIAPSLATFLAPFLCFLHCLLCGWVTIIPMGLKVIFSPWWAGEAFLNRQTDRFRAIYTVDEGTARPFGYRTDRGIHPDSTYSSFLFDCGILVLLAVGYRVLGFFILKYRKASKQL